MAGANRIAIEPESCEIGWVKTTLDLAAELVWRMKVRASREGKKLKGRARRGLSLESSSAPIVTGDRVRLPLIECSRPDKGAELGPNQISELLNAQEGEWSSTHVDSGG